MTNAEEMAQAVQDLWAREECTRECGPSRIRVGDLVLARTSEEALWLMHDSGEGMALDEERFLECLRKFMKEEF